MDTSSSAYELNHEFIIKYRVIWVPSALDREISLIKFTQEVKVATIFYRINKTRFISFLVYRRRSRDLFRISMFVDILYFLNFSIERIIDQPEIHT